MGYQVQVSQQPASQKLIFRGRELSTMSKSGKGQPGRKRPAKQPDDFFWDCSVCTYKNNPEAFKCIMCNVRKGTSTRKSRVNPDSVAVQVQQALLPPPPPQRPGPNPLGEPSTSQAPDDTK